MENVILQVFLFLKFHRPEGLANVMTFIERMLFKNHFNDTLNR